MCGFLVIQQYVYRTVSYIQSSRNNNAFKRNFKAFYFKIFTKRFAVMIVSEMCRVGRYTVLQWLIANEDGKRVIFNS